MLKIIYLIIFIMMGVLGGNAQSYTLPIFYLQTDSAKDIVSKDNYIEGSFWVVSNNIDEFESCGSEKSPLKLNVRGRGNHTWKRFDKKPFKLKFDKKCSPLGLSNSKHFLLMAHADDKLAFLHDEIGFEISRRLNLPWTPTQIPVELILNGKYWGLYFLTEQIKVASDRVNILEQKDQEVEIDNITGGWLLEIDQYQEDNQLIFRGRDGKIFNITYHSPESLSSQQESYLRELINKCDSCIFINDKSDTSWENLIDLDALAKFYLVNEIMDNVESFHGSCWFYKDRGAKEKLKFGPVWDFGYSVFTNNDKFIYDDSPYGMTWIAEIAKFPSFQSKVKELWNDFYLKGLYEIDDYVDSYINKIKTASSLDFERWPQYGIANVDSARNTFLTYFNHKINFLSSMWNGGGTNINDYPSQDDVIAEINNNFIICSNNEDIRSVTLYDMKGFRLPIERVDHNRYIFSKDVKGFFILYVVYIDGKSKYKKCI